MKVLLDTTVLASAILTPIGLGSKIIKLARAETFFIPVISEVIVAEFIAICRRGFKDRSFTEDEIDEFFEGLTPLLNYDSIEKVSIGKKFMANPVNQRRPINEVLYELTHKKYEHLIYSSPISNKLQENIDHEDLHVMVAAIEQDCDVIVTQNVKDFPQPLGKISVMKHGEFYDKIISGIL